MQNKKYQLLFLVALLIFVFVGCSDDNGTNPIARDATTFEWELSTGRNEQLNDSYINADNSIVTGGASTVSVTDSTGTYDVHYAFVAKLTSTGDTVWTQYLGHRDTINYVSRIVPDGDGYLVFFIRQATMYSRVLTVQKIFEDGSLGFEKTYLLAYSFNSFNGTLETSDDHVLLYGQASYMHGNLYPEVLKIDYNGDITWMKVFEFDYRCSVEKIIELDNGNYMLALNYLLDTTDFALMEISSAGDSLNFYHYDLGSDEYILDLIKTNTGYQALVFSSGETERLIMLCQISDSLKLTSGIVGTFSSNPWIDLGEIINDGFLLKGRVLSTPYLFKYDLSGAFKWQTSFSGSELDDMKHTPDNGCALAGEKNDNLYLIKVNNNGELE